MAFDAKVLKRVLGLPDGSEETVAAILNRDTPATMEENIALRSAGVFLLNKAGWATVQVSGTGQPKRIRKEATPLWAEDSWTMKWRPVA